MYYPISFELPAIINYEKNIAFDYYSAALTCYENYQHLAGQNRLSDCINQILHLENLTDKRYKTYSLFSGEEVPNIVHKELQK